MQGNYSKAIELFDQALQIDSNYEHAKNNKAEALNAWGDSLFQQTRYTEAVEKYNQSYQACSSGYQNEQLFRDNMNHAKAEVLNVEGNRLHNQKEYAAAIANIKLHIVNVLQVKLML